VQEFASPNSGLTSIEQQFDQKNIRRRVYDALNVLMAMNIISKEKKEIKWLGLPTNSMQECTTLEKDRQKRIERLRSKTQQLHDLIIQVCYFAGFFIVNECSRYCFICMSELYIYAVESPEPILLIFRYVPIAASGIQILS